MLNLKLGIFKNKNLFFYWKTLFNFIFFYTKITYNIKLSFFTVLTVR